MENINPDMDLTIMVPDESPRDQKESNSGPMFPGKVRPADLQFPEEGVERTMEHWGAFLMRNRVKGLNAKEWKQWIEADRMAVALLKECLEMRDALAVEKKKSEKVVNSYS